MKCSNTECVEPIGETQVNVVEKRSVEGTTVNTFGPYCTYRCAMTDMEEHVT